MYSQNAEEQAILDAVGDEVGVFLDVGAWDGFTFSNTMALVERGWRGVMVEPSAHAFVELLKRHGDNPNVMCVNALVGVERGIVPFWNCNGDALSTTERVCYDKWKAEAKFNPACHVAAVTFDDLFDAFPFLQFATVVSIDTEGTSTTLLRALPLDYRPKVICVEVDGPFTLIGYRIVYSSGENLVMVRE